MLKVNAMGSQMKLVLAVAGVVTAMSIAPHVRAASSTWSGSVNGNWDTTTTGNWTTGIPGAIGVVNNGDTATFNNNANTAVSILPYLNVKSITFDTASVGAFTLGGGPLLLTSGGTISTTGTVANSETFSVSLTLEGGYTFTSGATSSSATLNFGGDISSALPATLTLRGANTGANTISGVISDGSGVTSVTKNDAGAWTLSGNNTFSGNLSVTAGTLNITKAQSYSGATLVSGGTLSLSDSGAFGNTAVTVSGGTLSLGTASAITQNTLKLAGGTLTQTVANAISGSTAVSVVTAGTLSSWANNYSGDTTISFGSNARTVGGISSVCATALDFTQAWSPTTNIINNGVSHADIGGGSTLVLNGGMFAAVGAASRANSQEFNGLTVMSGSSFLGADAGAGGSMAIVLNGITRNVGGAVTFGPTYNATFGSITTTTPNADYTASGGSNTILGGWATYGSLSNVATIGASSWAVSAASGGSAGAITSLSSYTANTAGGELVAGADMDMSVAGGATVNSSKTINSLRFNNNLTNTLTIGLGQTLTVASGGILNTSTVGATATQITGGSITSGNGLDLVVHQFDASSPLTITSDIVNKGATSIGLTVNSVTNATTVISGNNTFTGPVTITQGTLKLGSSTALAGKPSLTLSATGVAGGSLDLNGYNATITGISDISTTVGKLGGINGGMRLTNNGASQAILTIDIASNQAFGGGIMDGTGSLGLVKSGTGTLTLNQFVNNNNDQTNYAYTGPTTISGGAIFLNSTGYSLSNSSVSINSTNGLQFGAAGTYTLGGLAGSANESLFTTTGGTANLTVGGNNADTAYSGVLSGLGTFAKTGTGSLILSGNNTYSGSTTVSGGTLVMSGANTYSGGTTVGGGTLQLGDARALGNMGALVTMNTANTTLDLHGSSVVTNLTGTNLTPALTAARVINNATATSATLTLGYDNTARTYAGTLADGTSTLALTKSGTNTLTLQGANTYTGGTTINGGTLVEDLTFYPAATATGNQTVSNALASAGNLTVDGGTFTLKGRNNSTLTTTAGAYATWAAGSNVINLSTASAIMPGQVVSSLAAGIPAGAYVVSMGTDNKSIVISANTTAANATATALSLTAATATNAQSFSAINYGAATIAMNNNNGVSTTLTADTLTRSGNGTLIISPSATTTLGSKEFFKVTGGLTPVNNMISPTIVGLAVSSASNGDFLTYGTNGFASASGSYTVAGAAQNTNTLAGPSILNVNATSTITDGTPGNIQALLVQSGITGTLSGTVAVGSGSGQAGVILNKGTLTGGTLAFGAAEGIIYSFNGGSTLGSAITGTGGVTFSGNQTLTLSNSASSWTGGVTYNNMTASPGGDKNIADTGVFGAASNVVTLNGATLNSGVSNGPARVVGAARTGVIESGGVTVNSLGSLAMNLSGPGRVVAGGGGTAMTYLSGSNTYTGGTILGGLVVVESDDNLGGATSTLTFSGGGLSIAGTGMANLDSHTVNFTAGQTAVFDIQSGDPAFEFTVHQQLNQAGGGLTKYGAGTLVLAAPETFTGGLSMFGGTLKVDGSQGASLTNSALTFGGGSLSLTARSAGTTLQTLGNVTLGNTAGNYGLVSNGGSLIVDSATGAGTTVNLGQFFGRASLAGNTFSINPDTQFNITTKGTGPVTVTSATAPDSTGIYTGRITMSNGNAGGTDWATTSGYVGAGYVMTPYTAYTTVTAPSGSDTNNSRVTGDVALGGNWTTNSLKLAPAATGQSLSIGAGNKLNLTSGGLLFTGANDYAIDTTSSRGTLASSSVSSGSGATNIGASAEFVVHQYGTGVLTINSVIGNNGPQAGTNLVKAGPGTLVLTAPNGYLGFTYINGGVLSISDDNNLGGGNGTLTGLTSVTTSPTVTCTAASLPVGFGLGSNILGRTVSSIAGTSGAWVITLNGNATTALGSSQSASWATAGSGALFLNGGTLQVRQTVSLRESNSAGDAGVSTASRPVFIGSDGATFDILNDSVLTITGGIGGFINPGGPVSLTLASSDNSNGVLDLNNSGSYSSNNFVGGVNINGGTLRLHGYASNDQGSLSSSGLSNVTFAPPVTQTHATLQLNGFSSTITGLTSTSAAGTVENGNGSAAKVTLTVNNGGANSFAGTLQDGTVAAGGSLSLAKIGGGTLTLTNTANTYSGATTITNGVLAVSKLADINTDSSIGRGSATGSAADLVLNGGTLRYTGSGDASDRPFEVTGLGGGIDSSGSGPIMFSGAISSDPASRTVATNGGTSGGVGTASDLAVGMTVSGAGVPAGTVITSLQDGIVGLNKNVGGSPTMSFGYGTTSVSNRTLTLTGTNAGANTVGGNLVNPTGALLAVAKTGAGRWILSGANTYTGPTTITGGTLSVNGSSTSAVSVNAGRLGGVGTIDAAVTVAGTGTLAAGNSVGTLSVASLTMASGATTEVEFGTGNDLVNVAGALTFGGDQSIYLYAENTTSLASLAGGTYHLFQYGSLVGDPTALLSVANDNPSDSVTYAFGTSTDLGGNKYVDLVVTIPEPLGAGVLGLLAPALLMRRRSRKVA